MKPEYRKFKIDFLSQLLEAAWECHYDDEANEGIDLDSIERVIFRALANQFGGMHVSCSLRPLPVEVRRLISKFLYSREHGATTIGCIELAEKVVDLCIKEQEAA